MAPPELGAEETALPAGWGQRQPRTLRGPEPFGSPGARPPPRGFLWPRPSRAGPDTLRGAVLGLCSPKTPQIEEHVFSHTSVVLGDTGFAVSIRPFY